MINRVVLVGRLTKNPELRYIPNGVAVSRFTLAVNRTFSNQQGEKEADFINCVIWRKQAENTANFLRKGSLAGVEGRIQTGSYEGQDGKRVYTTEIMVDSIQFLESKSQGEKNENKSNELSNQQPKQPSEQTYKGPTSVTKQYKDPYQNTKEDDDLPF